MQKKKSFKISCLYLQWKGKIRFRSTSVDAGKAVKWMKPPPLVPASHV